MRRRKRRAWRKQTALTRVLGEAMRQRQKTRAQNPSESRHDHLSVKSSLSPILTGANFAGSADEKALAGRRSTRAESEPLAGAGGGGSHF
jgi:hypothetical protein